MKKVSSIPAFPLAVVLWSFIFFYAAPCHADFKGISPVYTADEVSNFKALAQATIDALDQNNSTVMVAKLTDLETAWDDNEKTLKPKDPGTWTVLDKTLDKAISSLRSSKVSLPKGKAALQDLLKMFDQATRS